MPLLQEPQRQIGSVMRHPFELRSPVLRQPRLLSSDEIDTLSLRRDLDLISGPSGRTGAELEGVWLLILLALEAGLTVRELFMLQWQQIDFVAGSVRAIDYQAVTARNVSFGAVAIDLVRAPQVHGDRRNSAFVLPFWSGNISPGSVRRVERGLNRLLWDAFEGLNITFDDILFTARHAREAAFSPVHPRATRGHSPTR